MKVLRFLDRVFSFLDRVFSSRKSWYFISFSFLFFAILEKLYGDISDCNLYGGFCLGVLAAALWIDNPNFEEKSNDEHE